MTVRFETLDYFFLYNVPNVFLRLTFHYTQTINKNHSWKTFITFFPIHQERDVSLSEMH